MECAGNGGRFLEPQTPGEQWDLGAVSTGEWTGVSLSAVLDQAGPAEDAVEALFVGADSGKSPVDEAIIPFERSLPLDQARLPEVLLAFAIEVAMGPGGWSNRGCLLGLFGFWRMPTGLDPPLPCLDDKVSVHL